MKRKIFTRTNGLTVAKFLKSTVLKATLCLIVLLGLSAINANAQDWYVRCGSFPCDPVDPAYKLTQTSSGIFQVTVNITAAGKKQFVFATSDWHKYASNTENRIAYTGGLKYDDGTDIYFNAPVTGNYIFELNTNTNTYKITVPWGNKTFYAAGDWLGTKGGPFDNTVNDNFKLNIDNNNIGTVVMNGVTPGEHTFQITTAWDLNYKWDAANSKITSDYMPDPIPTANLTGGTYTLTVDFNTLTFTLVPGNTLPVTWVSFKGKATNNGVLLNWQTAEEKNNQYFEVERSTDGINYTTLAKVYPNSAKSYTYTDKQAQAKNIYRIKQVDNDGKVDYSDLVAVNVNLQNNGIIQYITNPSSNLLKVGLSKNLNLPAKLSVYGTNGTILKTVSVNDTDNNVIDISALANGVYVFGVEANGQAERKLFVKQ